MPLNRIGVVESISTKRPPAPPKTRLSMRMFSATTGCRSGQTPWPQPDRPKMRTANEARAEMELFNVQISCANGACSLIFLPGICRAKCEAAMGGEQEYGPSQIAEGADAPYF